MKSPKMNFNIKIIIGVLVVFVIIAIVLFLTRKGHNNDNKVSAKQTQWSTVGASTQCSSPWSTGTTYTISVQDPGFPETAKNSVALGPIVAKLPTQTCPTFQITATGITDLSMISVARTPVFKTNPTITAGKTAGLFVFTDNDNPYSGPPIAADVTVSKTPWSKKTTGCNPLICAPWKTQTYYKMTYSDITGVESAQLPTYLTVGPDPQNNNPNITTIPVSGYTMNVYRSTDKTTFSKIGTFDTTGSYTDNANPYQGPSSTPSATCMSWSDGSSCSQSAPSSLLCTTPMWKSLLVNASAAFLRPKNGVLPKTGCTSVDFETSKDRNTWSDMGTVTIDGSSPFSASFKIGTGTATATSPNTLISPIKFTMNQEIITLTPYTS
jgi:hypothetical protein